MHSSGIGFDIISCQSGVGLDIYLLRVNPDPHMPGSLISTKLSFFALRFSTFARG